MSLGFGLGLGLGFSFAHPPPHSHPQRNPPSPTSYPPHSQVPWYSSVTEREYYVDYSEPLLLVNGILTLFHVFDLLLIVCRYDSTMQLVVWWCGGVVVW